MEVLHNLGINWAGFLWHTINFLLLVVILSRVLYKPVIRMLEERAARVKESMERAEFIRQEAARTEEECRLRLDEAHKQAQAALAQATQIAEREKLEARQEMRAEAERILARARAQAQVEREQTMVQLQREVANLAVLVASKVIGDSLDAKAHRRLIEEFLAGDGQVVESGGA